MGKKLSPKMRRATEANEAVEAILAKTNRLGVDLSGIPEARHNALRLRRGMEAVWSPQVRQAIRTEDLISVTDHVSRYAVVDLWRQQGRVAYDLHPELTSSLYRADLKGRLPGELFTRLPHISPMLPLPRAWPFRNEVGREGLIRAYFLTGRVGQAFCPTTDPDSEGLALMPWIDFYDATVDEYSTTVTPLLALPSLDGPFTLDDVIDSTNDWHGTTTDGGERKLIKQILPGALSLLTYLCCDNRDVEEPPSAPLSGKRRQAPSRDPFYVRVGWKVGPKLHDNRMRAMGRTKEGVSFPSGAEQGPQHRAGHYKTVHHGPGRSKESVKWIDPYWTKLDMLDTGEEPSTTVVPVEAQRRDPSRRRDVSRANLGTEKSKEIRDREVQRDREEGWDW